MRSTFGFALRSTFQAEARLDSDPIVPGLKSRPIKLCVRIAHALDVQGDHEIFLSGHGKTAVLSLDAVNAVNAVSRGSIERGIDRDAESVEAGEDFGAGCGVVFADAAGEDDGVDAAEEPA